MPQLIVTKSTKKEGLVYACLVAGSVILPFLAWWIAAQTNPNGWMSDTATVVPMLFFLYLWHFWPLTVLAILVMVVAYVKNEKYRKQTIIIAAVAVSILYSLVLASSTARASEDEFTG